MLNVEMFKIEDECDYVYMSALENFLIILCGELDEIDCLERLKKYQVDIRMYKEYSDIEDDPTVVGPDAAETIHEAKVVPNYVIDCSFSLDKGSINFGKVITYDEYKKHVIIRTPGTIKIIELIFRGLNNILSKEKMVELYDALLDTYYADYPELEEETIKKINDGMNKQQAFIELVQNAICPKDLMYLNDVIYRDDSILDIEYMLNKMVREVVLKKSRLLGNHVVALNLDFDYSDYEDSLELTFKFSSNSDTKTTYTVKCEVEDIDVIIRNNRHWLCGCLNKFIYHIYCVYATENGMEIDPADAYEYRALASRCFEAEIDDLVHKYPRSFDKL